MHRLFLFVLIILLFFFEPHHLSAQLVPYWTSTYRVTNTKNFYPTGMVKDASNNFVMIGNGWDELNNDIVEIVKFDSVGNFQWPVRINDGRIFFGNEDYPNRSRRNIVTDTADNIYVAVGTYNKSYFILKKYSPNGTELWSRLISTPYSKQNIIDYIVVGDSGYIYICGASQSYNSSYNRYMPSAIMVVKCLTSSGSIIWLKTFRGYYNNAFPADFTIDKRGNVYVTGTTVKIPTNDGHANIATIKYKPNGDTAWVRYAWDGYTTQFGEKQSYGAGIVVDEMKNITVCGSQGFLVRYDSGGTILWTHPYSEGSTGGKLFLDKDNNIFSIGFLNAFYDYRYIVIEKVNSDGQQQWETSYYTGFWFETQLKRTELFVLYDTSGHIYITSTVSNKVYDRSDTDLLLLDVNPQSRYTQRSMVLFDANMKSYSTGVALSTNNYLYVGGAKGPYTNWSYDFLLTRLGMPSYISGFVFEDVNGNGLFETDESKLSGWKIKTTTTRIDSTETLEYGSYFLPTVPGKHLVNAVIKTGWKQSLPDSAGFLLDISVGDTAKEINFGVFRSGKISGLVFNDRNFDRVANTQDTSLTNWKVKIIKLESTFIDSTLTDTSGRYNFFGLSPGNYIVTQEQQQGWLKTYPDTNIIYSIHLISGLDTSGFDFGNFDARGIFGYSFNDFNLDGIKQKDELGLPKWKIYLTGRLTDSIVTDNKGFFNFKNLNPGSYYLLRDSVKDWLSTSYPYSTPYSINIDSINVNSIINFGHYYPTDYTYSLKTGWNLLSLPIGVNNGSRGNLFPSAISNCYVYLNKYIEQNVLKNDLGFWIKFNSNHDRNINGSLIPYTEIKVNNKWNIIGSISSPVAVSNIYSDPPGIITSSFFSYDGIYLPIDTIQPGEGYWVKVNQAGRLILSSDASKNLSARIKIVTTSEQPPPPPSDESSGKLIPTVYLLEPCYPNPFNPLTTIKYQLPSPSKVTLKVYNLLGQEVKTLKDEVQPAGFKSVEWNSTNNSNVTVASGIYFYRMEATNVTDPNKSFTQVLKMLLLK